MRVLVIDLCQRALSRSEFVEPIAAIVGEGAEVAAIDRISPELVGGMDAAIVCGTALADDAYLQRVEAFEWLRTTETPTLGICAGMQLVALLHGARLVEQREVGMVAVEPVEPNPLVPEPMEAYGLHRHGLEGLDAFRVLARSPRCVQAIAHRERPLFGVMFHPEVRRGNVVSRFMETVGWSRGEGGEG